MAAEPSGYRSAAAAAAVAAAADRAAVGEATQHCYGTLVAAAVVVVAVVLVAFDCRRFVATFAAGSRHCCCSCSCCCCAVGHGFRSFLVVDSVVGIVYFGHYCGQVVSVEAAVVALVQ